MAVIVAVTPIDASTVALGRRMLLDATVPLVNEPRDAVDPIELFGSWLQWLQWYIVSNDTIRLRRSTIITAKEAQSIPIFHSTQEDH